MAQQKGTQDYIRDIFNEAKNYYGLQKEYLRYTAAEQCTKVLSTLIIAAVAFVLGFTIFVFAGIAIVHVVGALVGNLALCYAIYVLILITILAVFITNSRRWVILPIAHLMADTFLAKDDNQKEEPADDKQ